MQTFKMGVKVVDNHLCTTIQARHENAQKLWDIWLGLRKVEESKCRRANQCRAYGYKK